MKEATWTFNPYHQRIDEAMERYPESPDVDTEWAVWEVFQMQRRGDHFEHVGAIHASDAEMALVMAKEQYARRGKCVQLWVVRSDNIVASPLEDADIYEFGTDKSYREAFGYKLAKRKRQIVEEVERQQES